MNSNRFCLSPRQQAVMPFEAIALRLLVSELLLCGFALGDQDIVLKKSFIEEVKNRATIQVTYSVDHAHAHPNTAANDGDLHVAGRAPEVGLPMVAEIMNAVGEESAVELIHGAEQSQETVRIIGVWRLWAEHPGGSQVQGMNVPKAANTNPDHVFEIHPVTQVGDVAVLDSFKPIDGFEPKVAGTAFQAYNTKRCKITPGGDTTTITTPKVGFNYVEFKLRVLSEPHALDDGDEFLADVFDLSGARMAKRRRMIFVKGTPPDVNVGNLSIGDELHVLGIPRVNLALIAWRASHAEDRPEVLTWALPYEIVVVGLYTD